MTSRLANNPRFHSAISAFQSEARARANELRTAYEHHRFADVASEAQWLKGAAGSLGYDVVTDPAAALERAATAGEATNVREHLSDVLDLIDAMASPNIRSGQDTDGLEDEGTSRVSEA